MSTPPTHSDLDLQLNAITLDVTRPLILCDADEVLLAFMAAFERFLHGKNFYYLWRSYALDGNICAREDSAELPPEQVRDLIQMFYAEHAGTLEPVAGAAEALGILAERANIIILTNIWREQLEFRRRQLASHGIDYLALSNTGSKGPPVAWFQARLKAPLYFIDDSPRHMSAVAREAPETVRIHFIAERRLSDLLDDADCHFRTDSWASARRVIEDDLAARGY